MTNDDFEPAWYRSLYWRAGFALISLVALLLVAEAALILWLYAGTTGAMPREGRQRTDFVESVASNLGNALASKSDLDIRQHLREQYGHYFETILVRMRDERIAANHDDIEDNLLEFVTSPAFEGRMRRGGRGGRFGRGGPPNDGRGGGGPDGRGPDGRGGPPPDGRGGPPPDDRGPSFDGRFGTRGPDGFDGGRFGRGDGPPGGPDGGRGGRDGGPPPGDPGPFGGRGGPFRDDALRPQRPMEIAQILEGERIIGWVIVPAGAPPFSRMVRVFGVRMGLVAGGVLFTGGALIALFVFGPPRRRLRQVQEATEQLGAGDLDARAPESGGDEIAAVARSFNRMADELTRRAKALESSDRVRRQLLADVSHELMTPLTAMRGYIETLGMEELQLDPPTRERYLRIVSEETHRLENIIGDLLDLARLEGGGTSMRREQVSIATLFNRVAERHEREVTARNITLDGGVGEGAGTVPGDPDRLEQTLQNLVANALRYTPDAGHITLKAERRDQHIVITVRDTGPGIPQDQLALIFDRFYKADASRRSAGGSGLGLSIVKAIIERHGGTISVRSDDGAVFEIVLPAS